MKPGSVKGQVYTVKEIEPRQPFYSNCLYPRFQR